MFWNILQNYIKAWSTNQNEISSINRGDLLKNSNIQLFLTCFKNLSAVLLPFAYFAGYNICINKIVAPGHHSVLF